MPVVELRQLLVRGTVGAVCALRGGVEQMLCEASSTPAIPR